MGSAPGKSKLEAKGKASGSLQGCRLGGGGGGNARYLNGKLGPGLPSGKRFECLEHVQLNSSFCQKPRVSLLEQTAALLHAEAGLMLAAGSGNKFVL